MRQTLPFDFASESLPFDCGSTAVFPKTVPCIAVQDPLGVSGRVGPGTKTWVSISLIAAVIAVPL